VKALKAKMASVQGLADRSEFETATVLRSPKIIINLHRKRVCTFGIGIPELVQPRRSLALSMPGGKAYCVISAHHRGAARRFLNF
jgi:hypothetical protein